MTADDFGKLLEAGFFDKIELYPRPGDNVSRIWCGRYEMGFSAEQIAAAADLGVDLWPQAAPGVADSAGQQLAGVVERLAGVLQMDCIPVWLLTPIEALDGGKPIDLIAAGEYHRVLQVVASLEDAGEA